MTKFSDEAADYDLQLKYETEKAYAFFDPGDGDTTEPVWLPKSQVEVEARGALVPGRIYTVTVPNWLAEEKGLL